MKKSFFAIAGALCAIIVIAFGASAIFSNSEAEYTSIDSYEDFMRLYDESKNEILEGHYELKNDIAFPESTELSFTATDNFVLKGNGYSISGLIINGGLFGTIGKNCEINGVKLSDCTIIVSSSNTGAFATENNGILTNCVVDSSVTFEITEGVLSELTIGGLVGLNDKYGFMLGCSAEPTFSPSQDLECDFGLLAGRNKGEINGSLAIAGAYNTYKSIIGYKNEGLVNVAYFEDNIYSLWNDDEFENISTEETAATLSESIQIQNDNTKNGLNILSKLWTVIDDKLLIAEDERLAYVFFYLDTDLAGAIVTKSNGESVTVPENGGKIVVCAGYMEGDRFNRNSVKIHFETNYDTMVNNFVLRNNQSYVNSMLNIIDHGADGYYQTVMFFDSSRNHIGNAVENIAEILIYPYCTTLSLKNLKAGDELVAYNFSGLGTEKSPYLIYNENEFKLLAKYVNEAHSYKPSYAEEVNAQMLYYNKAYYKLMSDITLTGEWTPIGLYSDSTNPQWAFRGVFDGNNHIIKNLKSATNQSYKGLFGYVYGTEENRAVIKDLTVLDADIKDEHDSDRGDLRGIIAGAARYTQISGCVVSGKLEGRTQIGGIVGYAMNSSIDNCGSVVTINTYYPNAWAGGITAYPEYTNIENCYVNSDIINNSIIDDEYIFTGAIGGYNLKGAKFANCFYVNSTGYTIGVMNGTSVISSSELKTQAFVDRLNDYSFNNGFTSYFGLSKAFDYPISVPMGEKYFKINVIANLGAYMTTDIKEAKPGDIVEIYKKNFMTDKCDFYITSTSGQILNIQLTDLGNGSLQFFMPEQEIVIESVAEGDYIRGDGEISPYEICTFEQLKFVFDCINAENQGDMWLPEGCNSFEDSNILIMNDIDCKNNSINAISVLDSISMELDGNGYTVSNLNMIGGFVGELKQHLRIKNIRFYNVVVTDDEYTGFFVKKNFSNFYLFAATVENCKIKTTQPSSALVYENVYESSIVTVKDCMYDNFENLGPNSNKFLIYNDSNKAVRSINNSIFYGIKGYSEGFGINTTANFGINNVYTENIFNDNSYINIITESDLYSDELFETLDSYEYKTNEKLRWNRDKSGRICLSDIKMDSIKYSDDVLKYVIINDDIIKFSTYGEIVECKLSDKAVFDLVVDAAGLEIPYIIELLDNKSKVLKFIMPDCPVEIYNKNHELVKFVQTLEGLGKADNPYLIYSAEDLSIISLAASGREIVYGDGETPYNVAHFTLSNDVDMNYTFMDTLFDCEFNGVFNGNGYTIKNFALSADKWIFKEIGKSGVVENLNLQEIALYNSYKEQHIGIFTKINKGRISNCFIKNFEAQGNINELAVFSYENIGTIEKCGLVKVDISSTAPIDTKIVGFSIHNNGIIEQCFAYDCKLSSISPMGKLCPIIYDGNSPIKCVYTSFNRADKLYGEEVSYDMFNNGIIAMYFNIEDGENTHIWKQNLKGENVDKYPVLDKLHRNVYLKINLDGTYEITNDKQYYIISNPSIFNSISSSVVTYSPNDSASQPENDKPDTEIEDDLIVPPNQPDNESGKQEDELGTQENNKVDVAPETSDSNYIHIVIFVTMSMLFVIVLRKKEKY